jgi:hypothetical protein
MIRIIVDDESKPAVLAAHHAGKLHEVFGEASYVIQEGWPEGPGRMRTIAGGSTANHVTHYAGGAPGLAGGAGGHSDG